MAIKVTRWTPDTCGCTLEYEWDDEDPNDTRVHTFSALKRKCGSHVGISDEAQVYDHVLKENQTKNNVYRHLLENVPRLKITHPDGAEELDPSVEFDWSFEGKDHDRQLVVNLKGAKLTIDEQDALDVKLAQLDKSVSLQ